LKKGRRKQSRRPLVFEDFDQIGTEPTNNKHFNARSIAEKKTEGFVPTR
jgi:hypothetical protein